MDVRGFEERGRCRQADEGRVLAMTLLRRKGKHFGFLDPPLTAPPGPSPQPSPRRGEGDGRASRTWGRWLVLAGGYTGQARKGQLLAQALHHAAGGGRQRHA